ISPSSDSSSSSLRRAKETRAAFATDRSSAITPSRRTNPWSRTGTASAGMTSVVATIGVVTLVCPPDGDPRRHLRLVVPELAPRLLPRRDAAARLPRALCEPLRHGRAEHDGLPPAERGPVPPLGRRGPRRLHV